jgi:hypothetical protein
MVPRERSEYSVGERKDWTSPEEYLEPAGHSSEKVISQEDVDWFAKLRPEDQIPDDFYGIVPLE